jgi:hypothetical protein
MVAWTIAGLLSLVGLTGGAHGVGMAQHEHHRPRFANCTHAVARTVADDAAEIELQVSCWAPSKGGDFGFSVTRLRSSEDTPRPGIRHFDRHPPVTGAGVVHRYGRCSWWRGSVTCRAGSRGRVTVDETIRVKPDSRCARPLSVTTTVTTCEPLAGKACPESLLVARLFEGKPRGC